MDRNVMAVLLVEKLVPTESLRDHALSILRQAIVSGEMSVGEIYSASALARRLGISTSPVREAMLTLVNEGVAVAARNRGFRLVALSANDLREIYELRLLLEVPAMSQVAALDLESHREELQAQIAVMRHAAAKRDTQEFLRLDREFHLGLLSLAGNQRLVQIVGQLRDQTRLYGFPARAEQGMLENSASEHDQIVEAIFVGDKDGTKHLVTQHLAHIRAEWSDTPAGASERDRASVPSPQSLRQ